LHKWLISLNFISLTYQPVGGAFVPTGFPLKSRAYNELAKSLQVVDFKKKKEPQTGKDRMKTGVVSD